MKFIKTLIAGTFDHFHLGHQWLGWEAVRQSDGVVVIVARDETVKKIKGRLPENDEMVRLKRVKGEFLFLDKPPKSPLTGGLLAGTTPPLLRGGRDGFLKRDVFVNPELYGSHLFYNHKHTNLARDLRKKETSAERHIWKHLLSEKQLLSLKFTRQKPLGNFIADFYCAKLLLVIEIGGDSHLSQKDYDQYRTEVLNDLSHIKVIRYTNEAILDHLDLVKADLEKQILVRKLEINPVKVRLGRSDANFWETIAEETPDQILLGYDQGFDEDTCMKKFPGIKINRAAPYFPEYFKSSKFRGTPPGSSSTEE